jgi:hypothetical protein
MEPAALARHSAKPTVSALLFTHQISDESAAWFSRVKSLFDELVIFVDSEKATPETRARARKVASRLYEIPSNEKSRGQTESVDHRNRDREVLRAQFRELRPEMVEKCESGWVLRLDSDEELSPEWNDRGWRQLLETDEFTHFYFPRRWMINSSEFIDREPWWPDSSLRLFRKDCTTDFPAKVHGPLLVCGRGAYCRNLAIHHHVLRLLSRVEREEKVRNYEFLWPGEGLGHYYLFEDYSVPAKPVPPPTRFDLSTELLQMSHVFDSQEIRQISLTTSRFPKTVRPGQVFWTRVGIVNNSDEILCSGSPYPVNLAYHWLDANSRAPVVFDGDRTHLIPGVASKTTLHADMVIRAPTQRGRFILQVTLVQESVRWFENEYPEIVQEAAILVAG